MRRRAISVFAFGVLSRVFSASATILLIRLLPVNEYAEYTIALSVVTLISQSIANSINRLYIISYKKHRLGDYRGSLLIVQSLVAASIAWCFQYALGLSSTIGAAIILLSIAIISSEYVKTEFQRQEKFSNYSWIEVARGGAWFILIAILMLVLNEMDAKSALIIQGLAIALITVPVISRLGMGIGMFRIREGYRMLSLMLSGTHSYLFLYMISIAVFSQLDVLMLKALSDQMNLATYGSAYRYYSILLLGLSSVHAVLLPSVAKIETLDELHAIYKKHIPLIIIFSSCVIASMFVAAHIIPWVDKGRYPGAVQVYWIMAASSILSFAFSPHVHLIMRFERFKYLFCVAALSTLLNGLLNILLIPGYGATGAAITTLVAFGVLNSSIFIKGLLLTKGKKNFSQLK